MSTHDKHPVDMHVGQRIRAARTLLGLTQQQLAEGLEITYQQLHKYELGINRCAPSRLYAVAKALGRPVAWFFDGLESERGTLRHGNHQRRVLDLVRHFEQLDRDAQTHVAGLVKHMAAVAVIGTAAKTPFPDAAE